MAVTTASCWTSTKGDIVHILCAEPATLNLVCCVHPCPISVASTLSKLYCFRLSVCRAQ